MDSDRDDTGWQIFAVGLIGVGALAVLILLISENARSQYEEALWSMIMLSGGGGTGATLFIKNPNFKRILAEMGAVLGFSGAFGLLLREHPLIAALFSLGFLSYYLVARVFLALLSKAKQGQFWMMARQQASKYKSEDRHVLLLR